jgi:hypothetical protein
MGEQQNIRIQRYLKRDDEEGGKDDGAQKTKLIVYVV